MGSTILLADKSVTIQKIVELTFADQNFVIKSVSDGQAALDAIPQLRPDLILADISLPIRNGYDVCRTLRMDPSFAEFSSVPVILLAGIYETMDEERARQVDEKSKEVGATELMTKPFDPQILTAKVAELLEKNRQPTGDEPTTIFAAPLDVSSNRPAASSVDEPPADDSERTMMLPKSVLMQNMFADAPVLEEPAMANSLQASPTPEEPRMPVNVEEISPAYEPVFDSEHDFAASEAGDLTFQEQGQDEPAESEPSILVPPTEDPFGEVFEEPQSWSPSVMTEEESPFGVPEPPAKAPEPIANTQPVSIPEPEEVEEPAMAVAPEEPSVIEPPAMELEAEPTVLEPPAPEAVAEETYEDTWPGVIVPGHQPVEELFEPEASPLPVSMEDETDLEPDLTEETEAEEPQAPIAPQTVQVTDDLVERIAERVVQKLSERVVSEIVWQVVPDLAEKMIRRELEKLHAGEE